MYSGKVEVEVRLEGLGSKVGKGDAQRTSIVGVGVIFGPLEALALWLDVEEGSLCVALKCDTLVKGPETEAVIAVGRVRRVYYYYYIKVSIFLRAGCMSQSKTKDVKPVAVELVEVRFFV